MSDLKALLDAYDAMSSEQKEKELKTFTAVSDAVSALQCPNEKMENTMFSIGLMAGLKYCPYCKQDVSPMSKCTVQRGIYHTDLVES